MKFRFLQALEKHIRLLLAVSEGSYAIREKEGFKG